MADPIRLLYAEDSTSDADLTREYFATSVSDFALEIVETGRACLDRIDHGQVDVLLLDNHLPDMDGIDVLRALMAKDVTLPIVMVTAVGDEDLVVQVLRLGAWDYVPKHGDYIATLPAVLRSAVRDYQRWQPRDYAARREMRRVLYIERHPADIDLTIAQLDDAAAHLRLQIAHSSTEGLTLLQNHRFDLILTDLRMPDMNAIDLLRELRRRQIAIPVIVVTGKGDEQAAVAALKLGAYDYIVKRSDYMTQLPYAIDHAIDRFQLAQANERLQDELAGREKAEAERAHLTEQLRQAQKRV